MAYVYILFYSDNYTTIGKRSYIMMDMYIGSCFVRVFIAVKNTMANIIKEEHLIGWLAVQRFSPLSL